MSEVLRFCAPATPEGGGALLAMVIRSAAADSPGVNFHTDPAEPIQVGTLFHPDGKTVEAHWHPPVPRQVTKSMEVIVVQREQALVSLYDPADGGVVRQFMVYRGDTLVLYGTGHSLIMAPGFRAVEVRQGPYLGGLDKVQIHPPEQELTLNAVDLGGEGG
jgi:hypothetical protein